MKKLERYLKLYEVVRRLDISTDQQVILSHIVSFTENQKVCYVSNTWLANEMNLSERQVRRLLKNLEDLELIERLSQGGKRILKPGPTCPLAWTNKTGSIGQNSPSTPDEYDLILKQMNR